MRSDDGLEMGMDEVDGSKAVEIESWRVIKDWKKIEVGCLFGVVDGDGADEVGARPGPGGRGGVPDAVSLEA